MGRDACLPSHDAIFRYKLAHLPKLKALYDEHKRIAEARSLLHDKTAGDTELKPVCCAARAGGLLACRRDASC